MFSLKPLTLTLFTWHMVRYVELKEYFVFVDQL